TDDPRAQGAARASRRPGDWPVAYQADGLSFGLVGAVALPFAKRLVAHGFIKPSAEVQDHAEDVLGNWNLMYAACSGQKQVGALVEDAKAQHVVGTRARQLHPAKVRHLVEPFD